MLRVTIDLIPFGDEKKKKTISEMTIGNTGRKNKHGEHIYKYSGWVEHEPSGDEELNKMFGRHEFKGTVENDRRNMVYVLLFRIIAKIIKPFGHTVDMWD